MELIAEGIALSEIPVIVEDIGFSGPGELRIYVDEGFDEGYVQALQDYLPDAMVVYDMLIIGVRFEGDVSLDVLDAIGLVVIPGVVGWQLMQNRDMHINWSVALLLGGLTVAGISLFAIEVPHKSKSKAKSGSMRLGNPLPGRSGNPQDLYEKFHGVPPKETVKMSLPTPKPGQKLTQIGRLTHVVYKPEAPSKLTGKLFEHEWGDTGYEKLPDQPILATDGKNFHIIPDKSKAKFNERGIVG